MFTAVVFIVNSHEAKAAQEKGVWGKAQGKTSRNGPVLFPCSHSVMSCDNPGEMPATFREKGLEHRVSYPHPCLRYQNSRLPERKEGFINPLF